MPAPANDDFANRITLAGTSGTASAVTIDLATTEGSEPAGSDVSNGIHQTVWYEWSPVAGGSTVFNTLGSTATDGNGDSHGRLDTTMTVWTGSALGSLVEVASDDDAGVGNFTSAVTFTAVGGTSYKIQVGTYDTPYTGSMVLAWTETVPPPTPAGPDPYLQTRFPTA